MQQTRVCSVWVQRKKEIKLKVKASYRYSRVVQRALYVPETRSIVTCCVQTDLHPIHFKALTLMDCWALLAFPHQAVSKARSLVPQLAASNGAALSHWSLPIMLFGNDNFCCSRVYRISSINHIYRLVCPPLLIIPLLLHQHQCKHVYLLQILFLKWALMAGIIFSSGML